MERGGGKRTQWRQGDMAPMGYTFLECKPRESPVSPPGYVQKLRGEIPKHTLHRLAQEGSLGWTGQIGCSCCLPVRRRDGDIVVRVWPGADGNGGWGWRWSGMASPKPLCGLVCRPSPASPPLRPRRQDDRARGRTAWIWQLERHPVVGPVRWRGQWPTILHKVPYPVHPCSGERERERERIPRIFPPATGGIRARSTPPSPSAKAT